MDELPADLIPSQVEIAFSITQGENGLPIGLANQSYSADAAGHYQLRYEAADGNDAEPTWQLELQGIVHQRGIRARGYSLKGEIAQRLMQSSPGDKETMDDMGFTRGYWSDGELDSISLAYLFMHIPPEEWDSLALLKNLYRIEILGKESLVTETLGTLDTWHVRLTRINASEKSGTVELWLASDFHRLPVRIRSRNSNGDLVEQTAVRIVIR